MISISIHSLLTFFFSLSQPQTKLSPPALNRGAPPIHPWYFTHWQPPFKCWSQGRWIGWWVIFAATVLSVLNDDQRWNTHVSVGSVNSLLVPSVPVESYIWMNSGVNPSQQINEHTCTHHTRMHMHMHTQAQKHVRTHKHNYTHSHAHTQIVRGMFQVFSHRGGQRKAFWSTPESSSNLVLDTDMFQMHQFHTYPMFVLHYTKAWTHILIYRTICSDCNAQPRSLCIQNYITSVYV